MNAEQQAEVARTNLLNRAYISLNDALHARACGVEPRYPLALIEGLAAEVSRLRERETQLWSTIQRERDLYAKTVDEYISYRLDYNGPASARDALDRVLALFEGETHA